MGDEDDKQEKKEPSAEDADFPAKSLSEKPGDSSKDDAKRHDKEQV
jgi:sec-independent protein translocase protein TatA